MLENYGENCGDNHSADESPLNNQLRTCCNMWYLLKTESIGIARN